MAFRTGKPQEKSLRSRCHLGGKNTKNSSSALKSAIHVKSLLSDLLILLQGSFKLLSTTLRDLKEGHDSIFGGSILGNILAFLSVASPQRQGSQI